MNPHGAPDQSRLIAPEAEQFVLGGLLIDNDAVDRIGDLRAEHFAVADHRAIFAAIVAMIARGEPADVLTVYEAIRNKGSSAGELAYLNALQSNTPSAANIKRHAGIVRDKAIIRSLLSLARETVDLTENSGLNSAALLDQVTSKLEALAQQKTKSEPILAADEMARHIGLIEERYEGKAPKGMETGFADVDKLLNGGPRRGQVIVVAARPKMGKTGFALNVAAHMARNYTVLVQSMEMPKSELHDRNIAFLGRIPLRHIISPAMMRDEDWANLTAATVKINDLKLFLDDQGGCTLLDIRMKAKQVKRRHGLDVLVIDYLQLMDGQGDNRNAQIEGITRGLKALAKELDIAIILLSQLNRALELRPNKRPQPSDLRDSGSIEQDADVVMFLYRDEVYNPDSTSKGVCEVDVCLNRQGGTGRVPLTFIAEQTRFENHVGSWQLPAPKSAPARGRGFNDD